MPQYEYKVVPAPKRGLKARGVKGSEARFAHALQTVMNAEGADGWEYQRTDTLPCEERQGLTGRTTVFQNMLVFRREIVKAVAEEEVPALIEDKTEETAPEPAKPRELSTEERVQENLEADTEAAASEPQGPSNSDETPRTHAAE